MKRIALILIMLMPLFVVAQSAKIQGVVMDTKGKPLPFVAVVEKGTTNGTISDSVGNFIIKVKQMPATLSFNCLGYTALDKTFNSGSEKVTITMDEDTKEIAEVNVTAKHGRSRTENVIIGVEISKCPKWQKCRL